MTLDRFAGRGVLSDHIVYLFPCRYVPGYASPAEASKPLAPRVQTLHSANAMI